MKTAAARSLAADCEPASHKSFPIFETIGALLKSTLERVLSLFADVRAGEGAGTLLLTFNIFLLLAGYSPMKPARDGLILSEGGAEVASYSAAAQGVLLMMLVPLYGWLGTRVVRITLITIVTIFFAASLVAFYAGRRIGLREGVAFYIWTGSSTSSSCRCSGNSPTICSLKRKDGGCFRSSVLDSRWVRGSARRQSPPSSTS
jgi:hypothetical protein